MAGNVDTIWTSTIDQPIDTAAGYSNGVVALNGVVLFPNGGTHNATGASQAAVDADEIIIASGFSGTVGDAGTSWTISADLVRMYGSGGLYYTDGAGVTDFMIIDADTSVVPIVLGGTITRLVVLRGNVTINGTITNLSVSSHTGSNADATVTVNPGGVITNIYQGSGTVKSSSTTAHTIWHMTGGTATRNAGGAITSLRVGTGATMIYKSVTTVTAAEVFGGGTLDFSQLTDGLTVTECVLHPRARLLGVQESGGLVTFTLPVWRLEDAAA